MRIVSRWCIVLIAMAVSAASTESFGQITGFRSASASDERTIEQKLRDAIVPDTLRSIVTTISREVHVAGTPAQARTRDAVLDRWKRAGLSTKVYPYEVYMPHATHSSLELVSPVKKRFDLREDTTSSKAKEYPWVNGYSGAGTVSGDVIYVNYGLHEDYHVLDSLGIDVKGKIVIARYGKSYRGIKAELAERAGAAGLLIYSDPSGDGYDAGDVLPDGPMRPANGVQRGSIYNGHGDPTTPGYASVPGARRVPADSMYATPKIPVIPISYGIAQEMLSRMHGHDIPNASWQGGLAFRYHVTAGSESVVVKMDVEDDRTVNDGIKPIWNTVATIEGSTWPDEWIIVGGHRDAWCYGAEDNASGCASVVAAAEAFGKLAKDGIRPKRSVLFVTWDAEEWGLLGSTEWVEQLEKELGVKAIAYINQDECATGSDFYADADPSLREFVYHVMQSIPERDGNPVYDRWLERTKKEGNNTEPPIGLLGGGSDFSAFYNHLGIPSLNHGFGGPFGQYHSNYDNIAWTLHYGDSTFRYHALTSQISAVEAMRLANAEILPFDFAELGHWLSGAVQHSKELAIKSQHDSSGFESLERAIVSFEIAGKDYAHVRDEKALSVHSSISLASLDSINRALRSVGLAFTEPDGLYFDKWERNLLVLADPENGYADISLPELDVALRRKNMERMHLAIDHLTRAVTDATNILQKAILLAAAQ